jgi:hypothetical protein
LQETTGTQKLAVGAKNGSVIIVGDSSFFKQNKEKKTIFISCDKT